MTNGQVAALRRFNRLFTERIGALNAEYLARPRPLGASRVLWEIGLDGGDVRSLRRDLGLDSGYLSRLIRTLEDDGLIAVRPDAADSRVRTVTLTRAGQDERALLDEDSDALARSLLAPLSPAQRTALGERHRAAEAAPASAAAGAFVRVRGARRARSLRTRPGAGLGLPRGLRAAPGRGAARRRVQPGDAGLLRDRRHALAPWA